MNNLDISLDKYLTQEPDSSFDMWAEAVDNSYSDEFWEKNKDWIMEYSGLNNEWLNKLYCYEPKVAAGIIERAFRFYNIKNK